MLSKNTEQTQKIAKDFLKTLLGSPTTKSRKSACVVGLYGELGAGKTFFTQCVDKELGIKQKITSPTFLIIKKYNLKSKIYKLFFHMDAYRLNPPAGGEKELLKLGWKDIIKNGNNLVFIEWPENVKKVMPKKHHKIKISHTKEGYRKFGIK